MVLHSLVVLVFYFVKDLKELKPLWKLIKEEKINTIIVLISVPNEEGIPLNPNLTNKETKEANTDEAIAYIIHFLPSLFSSSFFQS